MEESSVQQEDIKALLNKRPLIIAGPCSAETEAQVLQTAIELKASGKVDMLRAGIWKPRTRPGNFEGVGSVGLPWLQEAKRVTGLPYAIEIATAKQLEIALQHDVDAVWIGARTTVNPFSVQEVADALRGVDIPVLIKNPVNPDLELWTGALERVAAAGIENISLVHRGFSVSRSGPYRNMPMWHLAIEMKRRFPERAFIIDPSHICGNRHLLQEVAQHAVDLNYDGVIIESHIDPDNAWSDAQQQITPSKLIELLDAIVWRAEGVACEDLHQPLKELRERIDRVDDELLALMQHRMKISEQIGAYKKEHDITILQTERWNEILERVRKIAANAGLSQDFIKQYFDAIHMESIKHQDAVMNDKQNLL